MNAQSLDSLIPNLERCLKSNPNRSLSGVFKALRKDERISLIGYYPLLSFIIHYGHSRSPQYHWTRSQIMRAVKVSGFYRDEERKQAYFPKEWSEYVRP